MLHVLANRTYRHLFLAQLIALIGTGLAILSGRAAHSLLFGLTSNDPLTLAIGAVALLTVAAIASAVPAFRAARLDPSRALREE